MKNIFRIILVVACFLDGASLANAQTAAAPNAPAAVPSPIMPALPVAQPARPAAQQGQPGGTPLPLPPAPAMIPPAEFPALPPSRPCTKKDILGIWKLLQVYEKPIGAETASFQNSPVQYLLFNEDDTYARYNAGRNDLSIRGLQDAVQLQQKDLLQYVIGDSGMTYFYKNSVATDTQVCFIVANHLGNFLLGQMLLMPPEGQTQGRLVKVYSKIWEPQSAPAKGRRRRR